MLESRERDPLALVLIEMWRDALRDLIETFALSCFEPIHSHAIGVVSAKSSVAVTTHGLDAHCANDDERDYSERAHEKRIFGTHCRHSNEEKTPAQFE